VTAWAAERGVAAGRARRGRADSRGDAGADRRLPENAMAILHSFVVAGPNTAWRLRTCWHNPADTSMKLSGTKPLARSMGATMSKPVPQMEEPQFQATPYPHLVSDRALPRSLIARAYEVGSRCRSWRRQCGSTYRFWSMANQPAISFLSAEGAAALEKWETAARLHFGSEVVGSPTCDIFKFEDGDGVGIHDDSGLSAVRVAVVLSPTRRWSKGGAFAVFGATWSDTMLYRSVRNCGVCFETRRTYYHAVTSVQNSTLLLLVLQYPTAVRS
jgi:hypothetical protein